jgi:hypothetical protein
LKYEYRMIGGPDFLRVMLDAQDLGDEGWEAISFNFRPGKPGDPDRNEIGDDLVVFLKRAHA